jgi:glycosyltransferase involved in cell wall biosynthesis
VIVAKLHRNRSVAMIEALACGTPVIADGRRQ